MLDSSPGISGWKYMNADETRNLYLPTASVYSHSSIHDSPHYTAKNYYNDYPHSSYILRLKQDLPFENNRIPGHQPQRSKFRAEAKEACRMLNYNVSMTPPSNFSGWLAWFGLSGMQSASIQNSVVYLKVGHQRTWLGNKTSLQLVGLCKAYTPFTSLVAHHL